MLCFPYIFRGALDVRATQINEQMKMAAANALAKLAREPVPASVIKAYDNQPMSFGKEYIIPTPFDPRLIYVVSTAVARAAMESGVARKHITDWAKYEEELRSRVGGNFISDHALDSHKTALKENLRILAKSSGIPKL